MFVVHRLRAQQHTSVGKLNNVVVEVVATLGTTTVVGVVVDDVTAIAIVNA